MIPVEFRIGETLVNADISGRNLGTVDVAPISGIPDPPAAIRSALVAPIGDAFNGMGPSDRVVLVVSDSFRQTRADQVLPVLLDWLNARGIHDKQVNVLFSTGTHRGPTEDEQRAILGPAAHGRLEGRTAVHDAFDGDAHEYLGETSRGTPVEINRMAVECDQLIAIGAVVLHYFAGFGGGRKSIVPGLASARTIAANHSLNLHPDEPRLDPNVRIGAIEGNPVAEDMAEAAEMVEVSGIVNTVLNRHAEIAGVYAGAMDPAHLEACALAESLFVVSIPERADIVIAASTGTANFVQTHKALFNAWQAMKPGGRIVLLAPCPEGLGGDQFAKWLAYGAPESIIAELRAHSDINGQTALSTRSKAPSCFFVTDLTEDDVARLGGTKAETLQDAVDRAVAVLGLDSPTFCVMPNAAYSVPVLDADGAR